MDNSVAGDKDKGPRCALCTVLACQAKPGEIKPPPFCPMVMEPEVLELAEQTVLEQDALVEIARQSNLTGAASKGRWTRVEEIIDFAERLGVRKLGIACCIGLKEEARITHDIFSAQGFDVYSVSCGVGFFDVRKIAPGDRDLSCPNGYRGMCNPVGQAMTLEKAGTQLNIVMGLCLGHDTLFLMHSKVPTTVLVVKDKVLAHNPAAALYMSRSYYRRLMKARPSTSTT